MAPNVQRLATDFTDRRSLLALLNENRIPIVR